MTQDPSGRGTTIVATDVLWSDPVAKDGLATNDSRGVGITFGPDITQVTNFMKFEQLGDVLRE